MAASTNVEHEASIFLQKLIADRMEEPTKLASRLFLVRKLIVCIQLVLKFVMELIVIFFFLIQCSDVPTYDHDKQGTHICLQSYPQVLIFH
jgi:hypothetical protein